MRGNYDNASLRIGYANGYPIFISSFDGFYTKQEMKDREMTQGGPRTVVYEIGKKTIEGTIEIPLYVDKNGDISEGCRQLIKCADDPTFKLNLEFNRGMMHEPKTADIYNSPTSTLKHKRVTLECCAVSQGTITVPSNGGVTMSFHIKALPDPNNTNSYDLNIPISDMMVRQCTYADCLITIGEDNAGVPLVFKENVKEFSLNFENNIEELYLLGQNDYANSLIIGKTNINGEWTEAVKSEDWEDEAENYNHGGYVDGEKLRIRLADITGYIDDVLYEPQYQPIAVGLLNKKTKFKATFRYGWVGQTDNLIFRDL